jgi:hypothetical protein
MQALSPILMPFIAPILPQVEILTTRWSILQVVAFSRNCFSHFHMPTLKQPGIMLAKSR